MMERELRLCFLTPEYALRPPFGGIATYTRDAARWLASAGHEVHIVLPSRLEPAHTEGDEGVRVHFVPATRIRIRRLLNYASRVPGLSALREAYCGWGLIEGSLGTWRTIRELSKSRPFDLIEVADSYGLGFWGTANRFRGVPILIRSHGYIDLTLRHVDWCGARLQFALERFSVRRANFVLAASQERVAHYRSTFGVAPSKIAALPYGIAVDRRRGCFGLRPGNQDSPSILYLGRVERRKGCDVLLEALRIVKEKEPRARVTFVGQVAADMEGLFWAFTQESNTWVRYVPAVPQGETAAYLRQSDMLVLPSRFETLPRVLIEALAAGVPQVATPVNGIPEIVEDGVTGLLVELDNPAALAEAILQLCNSPGLRAEMGRRSRRRALERFEISAVMAKQVRVYRALTEGRSPLLALDQ